MATTDTWSMIRACSLDWRECTFPCLHAAPQKKNTDAYFASMIIVAAFVLHVGHPGPGLSELRRKDAEPSADVEGKGEPLLSNIRT